MIGPEDELGVEYDGLVVLEDKSGEPFCVPGRYSLVDISEFGLSVCQSDARPTNSRRTEAAGCCNFMELVVNLFNGDLTVNRVGLQEVSQFPKFKGYNLTVSLRMLSTHWAISTVEFGLLHRPSCLIRDWPNPSPRPMMVWSVLSRMQYTLSVRFSGRRVERSAAMLKPSLKRRP